MALVTLFANNPSTTAASSSGTTTPAALTTETWTVASSAAFPAAVTGVSQFHIADPALAAEIIAVTNVSGTTWSVTRGVEGTTPVAHATGATYYQVVSAADLTGLLQKSGGALTGALTLTPVVLTDASSIAVNAALGNGFVVTLGGNRTLANPSNPTDGQAITVEVIQDGTGSRTLAYGTAYQFPASIGTPVLSTAAASRDFLAFRYESAVTTWWCTGFVPAQSVAAAATVSQGGTGDTSLTAYALLAGGATSTGAVQQVSSLGTSGWVLTSNGPGALPTFQAASSGFANPMTTSGDLIYENATPAAARLAGNTSATKNFLTQTGNGSVSAAPSWGAIAAGDLPAGTVSTQGALQLDGTASDIQATGSAAAAGNKGQAADAKHVHAQTFLGVFGTGTDGSATFDGTTTVISLVPSSSIYTLTRDIHCTSITVNNGVTVKTANYRIFCRGTITVNSGGTISNNGNNASGASGGGVSVSSSFGGGRAGGAGGTGVSGPGGAGTTAPAGNASGAGGAGTSGTGGAAATPAVAMVNLQNQVLPVPIAVLMGFFQFSLNTSTLYVGASGGGGGSDASSNAGGGGGGGAGVLALLAYAVTNSGTISATGGNGAAGTAGNAGGGGGGSGGLIVAYTLSAWTAGTTAVTGGTAGAGSGTGSAGSAGSAGLALNVVLG